jgi:hypothetical protein
MTDKTQGKPSRIRETLATTSGSTSHNVFAAWSARGLINGYLRAVRASLLPLALLSLSLPGCKATWTRTQVHPGELALPSTVRTVAVVDRSGASLGGAVVAAFMETLDSAASELRPAPPDAVATALAGDAAAVRTAPVGPASALALCVRAPADAIVTLHGLESAPHWNFEREGDLWNAWYNARATASWRVWDCAGLRVHDVSTQATWAHTAVGADRPAARAAVPDSGGADREAAKQAGRLFAARLAPEAVQLTRHLFRDHGLAPGVRALRAGDLDGAAGFFRDASTTLDAVRRARALHDLAVVVEAQGDVERALEHVADALVMDPHPATVKLRAALVYELLTRR